MSLRSVRYLVLDCHRSNYGVFEPVNYIWRVFNMFAHLYNGSIGCYSFRAAEKSCILTDIFVIRNKRRFELAKKLFEGTMDRIKPRAVRLKMEIEKDNKLPFLNVMVENINGT